MMETSHDDRQIELFVLELLRTGSMLSQVVLDLAAELPVDASSGEKPAAVVFEMLCGTIASAMDSVATRKARRATELIELARARALEHLQLACDLSARIHDGDGGGGCAYG